MDANRVAMPIDEDWGAPLTDYRIDNRIRSFIAVSKAEVNIWDRAIDMHDYQKQIVHFVNSLELFLEDYQRSFVQTNIIANQHDQLGQGPGMMPPHCNLNPSPDVLRKKQQFLLQGMGEKFLTVPGWPCQETVPGWLCQELQHMPQNLMVPWYQLGQQLQIIQQMGEIKEKLRTLGASTNSVAMLPQVMNEIQQIQEQLDRIQSVLYTFQSDQVYWTPDDIRQKQQSLKEKYGNQLLEVDKELNNVSSEVSLVLVDSPCFNVIDKGLTDAKNAVFNLQQLLQDTDSPQIKLRIKLPSFEQDRCVVLGLAELAIIHAKYWLHQQHQTLLQSQGPLPLQKQPQQ